jgi:hypothetical protein
MTPYANLTVRSIATCLPAVSCYFTEAAEDRVGLVLSHFMYAGRIQPFSWPAVCPQLRLWKNRKELTRSLLGFPALGHNGWRVEFSRRPPGGGGGGGRGSGGPRGEMRCLVCPLHPLLLSVLLPCIHFRPCFVKQADTSHAV